ncbi:ABC transporter substrate-binding protein [Edwardsiella ictaluri]|uniref:ABC transporter substrate-binding protein n=1 Tax=Edwardsiella ictaluri TaxID=67780 RepID=UPI000A41B06D
MIFNFIFRFFAPLALLFSLFSPSAQALTVSDSRGTHQLPAVPTRAVVLDWDLLEQTIELGVTPLAATDLDSYREWVAQPPIPAQTQSVGSREEPNLERIAALKPDVILASEMQQALLPRLMQIAPVLYYTNFSAADDHAAVAIAQFRQLAQAFGREAIAEQKLAAMQARFQHLSRVLRAAFQGQLPAVTVMRFASTTSTYLYTTNSMPVYVLRQLGISPALTPPPARWGIVRQPIAGLQRVGQGYVLYFLPFHDAARLDAMRLWQAMPFVRGQRVSAVRPVWSYGGAMSLQYAAEAMAESLMALAAQK